MGVKVKVKDISEALAKHHGNISAAARELDVSRMTIYRRIEENDGLRDVIESAKETKIDNIEEKLYTKAMGGDTTAMIFFLKTQGKSRGYTERQEITGIDGNPVNFIVSISNNGHQD
ncbi:MAG: HTH domain-containing protein [Chloroflexi bacterium]|jgi:hypothetical protein|nr:HTH domain-containing protein [Chloroflexota bacterium]